MARMRSDERRTQILSAARESFLVSGPEATRVRDIAERAGVNEALLYRHFDSKDDLFRSAIVEPLNDVVSRLLAEATALPAEDEAMVDHTYRFYHAMLGIFSESIELFGVVLFSDRAAGREFYATQMGPFMDAVSDTVRSNLAAWSHRTFDPDATTPLFVGMCWGLAMDAHFRDKPLDLEAAARLMTDITFGGLR